MRFLYDNKWISLGGTITASSEATGYGVASLGDYLVATKWRSTGDSDEWVKINFGSAVNITAAALIGHNFTNGATVKVQGHTSDTWSSPGIDETITWRDYIMDKTFTGGSRQWWRVHIADASNPDTHVEFGYLVLAVALSLGDIINADFAVSKIENSIINESRSGQVYGDVGIIRRLWTVGMPHLDVTEKGYMDTMFDTVGKHTPFVFMLDETDTTNLPPAFGRFSVDLDYNHIFDNNWNLAFAILEVF